MESIQEQEIYILMGIGIGIMLMLALTVVVFFFLSQRRLFEQRMEAQAVLLQRTIMTQEDERSRIAKELHDEIGSKLSVIFLHSKRIQQKVDAEARIQSTIEFVIDVINTTIDSTRRISHELLPPVLEEFGFIAALDELCQAYHKAEALKIDLQLNPDNFIIKNKVTRLNLFRILQELISNSIRHGEAEHVRISCICKDNALTLWYEDDGKGFDAEKVTAKKGLGMRNIESRLQMIRGTWKYESELGKGVQMELNLKQLE